MRYSGSACGVLLALCLMVLPIASCGNNRVSDEQQIRDANTHWLQLIAQQDAQAIANLYAEDGSIFPPGAPIATGREAVGAVWHHLFEIPGFSLTFETTKLSISRSNDMAIDIGTYTLTTGVGDKRTTENGKYVVTWMKRGGTWQAYTDIFNANAAP